MKLDVDVLRYLSKDDFRVLTAVELGMRNVRCSIIVIFCFSLKKLTEFEVIEIQGKVLFIGSFFIAA